MISIETQIPKPTMKVQSHTVKSGLCIVEELMNNWGIEINMTHIPCTIQNTKNFPNLSLTPSNRASPPLSWARQARKSNNQALEQMNRPVLKTLRMSPLKGCVELDACAE